MDVLKIFLNAVVSEESFWSSCDITDYYLGTPMDPSDWQWMYIDAKDIPQETIDLYDIEIRNGKACVCIMKGMYGLPNAGRIAQDQLIGFLEQDGYEQQHTECLFKHNTRDIYFMLVVDDFGIKHKYPEDLEHLHSTLKKHYTITCDPTGSKYLGINIDHDRENSLISLSMPNYVSDALARFGVQKVNTNTHSPLVYHPIEY